MTIHPRIIVPTDIRPRGETQEVFVKDTYVQLLLAAGAAPVLVPPVESFTDEWAAAYAGNGVLLIGGDDLSPDLYDQELHPAATLIPARRQASELAWFDWAQRTRRPLLGICLGCQVINVARGGSLIQSIPDAMGLDHGRGGRDTYHDVKISGELLGGIAGPTAPQVNSRHLQAVDRIGEGLRVAGRVDDGVIEAIEDATGKFILGLQWHPEDLPEHPTTVAVMQAFVEEARKIAANR